jgi:hypothetical protein
MSGILDLVRLECSVKDVCPLYVSGNGFGVAFVALDFYPIILTVVMYAITLYHSELYFFLMSAVLTIDWIVNLVIQLSASVDPRYEDCGVDYGMPSFSTQHITVFVTMILTFGILWKRKLSPYKIVLLGALYAVVVVARVYIGSNRNGELLTGTAIGFTEGCFFQWIIYSFIYPHFPYILSWKSSQAMGFEDTLCCTTANSNDKKEATE